MIDFCLMAASEKRDDFRLFMPFRDCRVRRQKGEDQIFFGGGFKICMFCGKIRIGSKNGLSK